MNVAQTSPAINDAWGVIKVLSGDERARALAEAREKARMDLDSYMDDARYEGEQAGLQKGKVEVVQNALRKNMAHDVIADITGLPLDEIQRIANLTQ